MWTVKRADLPTGRRGQIDWTTKTIVLDVRLSPEQVRCTLAHEWLHASRGPVPRWLTPREERAINRAVARELIELDALLEALRWSGHPGEVAEQLGVTTAILWSRLNGLHPSERHWLERNLS